MKNRFLATAFFLVIACFSAFLAVLMGLELKNGYASKSWPAVPGRVTKFEVLQSIGDQTDYISIEYAYTVEEKQYVGERISFKMFGKDESIEDLRRRIGSVGAGVSVHYDPQRESQAVLYPGWNWVLLCFFIITCGLSVVFVPFSLLFLLELWGVDWGRHFRMRKRNRGADSG